MGHDHKRQRDLSRDLGPICRQQFSKHHLLKAESTAPFLFISYSISNLFDLLLSCSYLHVSMIMSLAPSHNHAYYYMSSLCYRCLGPPTFFSYSALSTIPLPMRLDNQRQRDLLRDLGQFIDGDVLSITFWRLSPLPFLLLISFYFWTYLYHHQHDYTMHYLHVIILMLSHQHNWLIFYPL